ncbi:MAG TPA: class I SAM-dependent methyltransferase [Rubrobacteraceae bacterium]|nr:class I SAM-dependent methyltransferase [Rubrobacteraceae bacterium]
MTGWYREDLAHIHDAGFGDYALGSAPGILKILGRSRVREGLVVDLGCGSGLWARELVDAGYRVLGIDISEAMVEISRRRVPEAEFRVGSLFDAGIPPCNAVTAVGEVLNYLFDPQGDEDTLLPLFRRVHGALAPGGVFVFDVAEPGQVRRGISERSFTEGDGWVVLVEKEEDTERSILTRRISTFRQVGESYRRDDETHRQRLYRAPEVAGELRRAGFRVRARRAYGAYRLPEAHAAFVARRPA